MSGVCGQVDYVGHAWFFRPEWTAYLWREYQPTWEACEDVAFSASAWLHGRIRTLIPAMPDSRYEVWGDSVVVHHKDGNETFTKTIPGKIRWPVTRYWMERGWIPTAMRNQILPHPGAVCRFLGLYCQVLQSAPACVR